MKRIAWIILVSIIATLVNMMLVNYEPASGDDNVPVVDNTTQGYVILFDYLKKDDNSKAIQQDLNEIVYQRHSGWTLIVVDLEKPGAVPLLVEKCKEMGIPMPETVPFVIAGDEYFRTYNELIREEISTVMDEYHTDFYDGKEFVPSIKDGQI